MYEYCGSALAIAACAASLAAAMAARQSLPSLADTAAASVPSAASATIATLTVSLRCSAGSRSMRAVLSPAGRAPSARSACRGACRCRSEGRSCPTARSRRPCSATGDGANRPRPCPCGTTRPARRSSRPAPGSPGRHRPRRRRSRSSAPWPRPQAWPAPRSCRDRARDWRACRADRGRHVGRRREHVPRHLDGDRPGRPEVIAWKARRPAAPRGMFYALGELQQRLQRGELVRHLVQLPAAAADHGARHLARDAHHRR